MEVLEFLKQPWTWYFSGTMIAAIMVTMLYFGKSFGLSSNLRIICSACGAGKYVPYFNFEWKRQKWNLFFLAGAIGGGIISSTLLKSDEHLQLSRATIDDLKTLNVTFDGQLNPSQIFSFDFLLSIKGMIVLLGGGILVGFGSRYAGGCTSGHAISGLSNLQVPSLIAVIGFFAGGLFMTYVLFPLIFN
jgi:uncharacterized protein